MSLNDLLLFLVRWLLDRAAAHAHDIVDISRRRHDVALLLSVLGVPRDLYQECSRWPGMDYVVSVIDSYIIATLMSVLPARDTSYKLLKAWLNLRL